MGSAWRGLLVFVAPAAVACASACGASSTSSDPAPAPLDASAPAEDAEADAAGGDLCQASDGDLVPTVPAVAKAPRCTGTLMPDDAAPLFADVGALPADYATLHALCARMNPEPGSLDHLTDASLEADVRAYFATMLERPAMRRALAGVPESKRLDTALSVWLDFGGFEHVLCGDLNPNGTVGGLHLWSEYYLAEREGRADYACTVDAKDERVAAVAYRWRPPGRTDSADKPLGSFLVGMSPACLLAVGVRAVRDGVEGKPGNEPAFRARLYGVERGWALGVAAGSVITLYPLAE